MKFYRNQKIEDIAQGRLNELEQELGSPLTLPIPIDLVAEKILGLDFLWEPVDEQPGEIVFGGLIPKRRLIVLNEKRRGLFEQKPGLERSTKGHEMGHWDLFINQSTLDHPELFEGSQNDQIFALRTCPAGDVQVIKVLCGSPEGLELLHKIDARADDPNEARAVNRYAAALSMPRPLLREEALKINRTAWPELYRLAENSRLPSRPSQSGWNSSAFCTSTTAGAFTSLGPSLWVRAPLASDASF
jgi:hypothetical protein